MASNNVTDLVGRELVIADMGGYGIARIAAVTTAVAGAGSYTHVSRFISATAINAAATYGASCATDVSGSSVPAENDSIPEGTTHKFNLTTLDVKTGVVYATYIPQT